MNHTLIGLDLAKSVFHAVKLDCHGKPTWRKKFSRAQLKRHFANRQSTRIAMEACASAHYWARLFEGLGHTVLLLPPRHVKAYLRGQKNDYNDAQAIAEFRNVPDVVDELVMAPVELLKRLAALIPSPGTHMTRYHGVFANRSKFRRRVPAPPPRVSSALEARVAPPVSPAGTGPQPQSPAPGPTTGSRPARAPVSPAHRGWRARPLLPGSVSPGRPRPPQSPARSLFRSRGGRIAPVPARRTAGGW